MNAQSITNLAYESINEKYSRAKYGVFNVIMDMSNGYINATKLCADGGKLMKNWLKNDSTKNMITYYKSRWLGLEPPTFVINGGQIPEITGTYVHPDIIPHIASWVSIEFAFKVSKIVNEFLAREKEDEIRRLTGDKCRLEKMFEESEKRREEAEKRRECDHEESKKMLQKMTEQNEKTHKKLDKADCAIEELQNIVEVVNTRMEIVADEIVKPSKRVEVHEQFVVMKLNDDKSDYNFKVFCSQNKNANKAKSTIIKEHCDATVFLEIMPSPNSKNFLHNLKDLYGTNKHAQIIIYYNYITLLKDTSEQQFIEMVNNVVNSAKNLGNENSN